jgi:hypothetical protein
MGIGVTPEGTKYLTVGSGGRQDMKVFRELKLKARDQRKGYVMKDKEVVEVTVQQNLRHMELPLC